MGQKIEREAVAALVLPQLWAMCVGPLLNVEQFGKFMRFASRALLSYHTVLAHVLHGSVIRTLTDRVEKEHSQHLRDAQRIEDRSTFGVDTSLQPLKHTVDFESLVGSTATKPTVSTISPGKASVSWEDDVWGSILGSEPVSISLGLGCDILSGR